MIEEGDLRGAFHNHTAASDGHATLEEMAAAADALGWEYLGIADHSKSSFQAHGLSEERLLDQVEKIRALNAAKKFRVHIFAGSECDILKDGELDYDDGVLAKLDYVVASVHNRYGQGDGRGGDDQAHGARAGASARDDARPPDRAAVAARARAMR